MGLVGSGNWVAFGLNENMNGMIGAELVVCSGETVAAQDYHSLTYGSPVLDEFQDWEMISGGRQNGLT